MGAFFSHASACVSSSHCHKGAWLGQVTPHDHAAMMFFGNSFDGNDNAYWSYMTNKLYKKVGASDVTLAYDAQGNLLQSGAFPAYRCC